MEMVRSLSSTIAVVAVATALSMLTGCSTSPPSRFYILNSPATMVPIRTAGTSGSETILAIGPVTIPDYLDRPEIVTRNSGNQLTVAQFDRWGASMATDINRVLAENLSSQLGPQGVSVVTWKTPASIRYRVPVHVTRFEASGETVVLWAQWAIVDREGNASAATGESVITKSFAGNTYLDIVASMSNALADLSNDMARTIKALIEKGTPHKDRQ